MCPEKYKMNQTIPMAMGMVMATLIGAFFSLPFNICREMGVTPPLQMNAKAPANGARGGRYLISR